MSQEGSGRNRCDGSQGPQGCPVALGMVPCDSDTTHCQSQANSRLMEWQAGLMGTAWPGLGFDTVLWSM